MRYQVYGDEVVCPKCGDFLSINIDIGDGHKYDICHGCGFKRKKNAVGQLVDKHGQVLDGEVQEST